MLELSRYYNKAISQAIFDNNENRYKYRLSSRKILYYELIDSYHDFYMAVLMVFGFELLIHPDFENLPFLNYLRKSDMDFQLEVLNEIDNTANAILSNFNYSPMYYYSFYLLSKYYRFYEHGKENTDVDKISENLYFVLNFDTSHPLESLFNYMIDSIDPSDEAKIFKFLYEYEKDEFSKETILKKAYERLNNRIRKFDFTTKLNNAYIFDLFMPICNKIDSSFPIYIQNPDRKKEIGIAWEKICLDMINSIKNETKMEIYYQPVLSNSKIPDIALNKLSNQKYEKIIECKKSLYFMKSIYDNDFYLSISDDYLNYKDYCDNLEFWVLENKQEIGEIHYPLNSNVSVLFVEDIFDKYNINKKYINFINQIKIGSTLNEDEYGLLWSESLNILNKINEIINR